MADILGKLKQFDAYPKTLEDFRVKTYGGAAITLVSATIIALLFLSELTYFLSTDIREELFVDTARADKLKINFDIDFPRMPCLYLSIDAMDVSGEHHLDVLHSVYKTRLAEDGKPIAEEAEQYELGASNDEEPENPGEGGPGGGGLDEEGREGKQGEEQPIAKDVVGKSEGKCGSCYGAETAQLSCCNTCEDVREAYRLKGWAFNNPKGIEQCITEGFTDKLDKQTKEGCKVGGYIEVNKVGGNIHFAPGKSFQQHNVHVHDLQPFGIRKFNFTHTIHRLSFGEDYPGQVNPLDNFSDVSTEDFPTGGVMYQYFVKVVPTVYNKLTGQVVKTNQFSVTRHKKAANAVAGSSGLPGVFFMYDLSPMLVQMTEHRRSLAHFLTGVCAIVGGVFTVAGMVDGMLYHSTRALKKKIDLGKAS